MFTQLIKADSDLTATPPAGYVAQGAFTRRTILAGFSGYGVGASVSVILLIVFPHLLALGWLLLLPIITGSVLGFTALTLLAKFLRQLS